jgi:hypothetical protein
MLQALFVRDEIVQLLAYYRWRDEDFVDSRETGV